MRKRLTIALAVVAGTLLLLAGVAIAQIPGTDGVITACYTKQGVITLIDVGKGETCKNKETKLTWNQTGPQGAQGLPGAPGPVGPAGPPGSSGGSGGTVVTWTGTVVGELVAMSGVAGGDGERVEVRTPEGVYVAYSAFYGDILGRLIQGTIFASADCSGSAIYVDGNNLSDEFDFYEGVQKLPLQPMDGIPSNDVAFKPVTLAHVPVPATAPQYSFRHNTDFQCSPYTVGPSEQLLPIIDVTSPVGDHLGRLRLAS